MHEQLKTCCFQPQYTSLVGKCTKYAKYQTKRNAVNTCNLHVKHGRRNGLVVPAQMSLFLPGSGIIWLSDLECTGTEDSLEDCPHAGWGQHKCGHYEDVAISCKPNPIGGE